MQGRIVKGVGGLYQVLCQGELFPCNARGRFRRDRQKPMVGDWVCFDPPQGDGNGYLTELLPRKNALLRPSVANVDLLVLVAAAAMPQPDLLLIDQLLTYAAAMELPAALVVNKADLADPAPILAQYGTLAWALPNDESLTGVPAIWEKIRGKTVCLAGQSGVGKSTLIAALTQKDDLAVGSISPKTLHGRHTTRHVELLPVGDGFVVDTPGFSLLEMELLDPARLKDRYPEYAPYEGQCRFQGCLHDREPGCAVREAVRQGILCPERHERYRVLLAEARQKWKERYD